VAIEAIRGETGNDALYEEIGRLKVELDWHCCAAPGLRCRRVAKPLNQGNQLRRRLNITIRI
jgi:hypothetical protein